MNKFAEFYTKAMADEQTKAELDAVIGGNRVDELTDEEILKVGKIAEKFGFAITLDEAKAFFAGESDEISDDELDMVAGGFSNSNNRQLYYNDKSKIEHSSSFRSFRE